MNLEAGSWGVVGIVGDNHPTESPSFSQEVDYWEGESDKTRYIINKDRGVFEWDEEVDYGLENFFGQEKTSNTGCDDAVNVGDIDGNKNCHDPLNDEESDIGSSWDNEDVIEAFEAEKL
ncbi:hypothetical protein PIB30_023414 [Stylosanthes scabra]|uniref:Uncharacterized protein n=1 Tax=Stylosanthes scabra TaxID=79078 RepID=A0ABU6XB49_9FABA|nr:hypothetical protein [Stylosanthes scabra]